MGFAAPGLRPGVEAPYDWGPSMSERQQRLRLTAALVTSAALHAVTLAILLWSTPLAELFTGPPETPEAKLIRVSLVSRPGGGGGGPLPGPPSPDIGPDRRAPTPEPLRAPKPSPPPPPVPRVVERKPPPVAAPSSDAVASLRALAPPPPSRAAAPQAHAAPTASDPQAPPSAAPGDHVATLGTGLGGTRGGQHGGAGTGDGSGGDGSDGLARPAYGFNPKPPYPLAARRLGVEGVVLLDVLVRPDGSPAEVRVRTSSGSALLDDSAVETVRSHWRFIPARRGNVPVESRVSFPIRFKLDAG
jgi:periplasmic protein TonB